MRTVLMSVAAVLFTVPLLAQAPSRRPPSRPYQTAHAYTAEASVKQAMEQLVAVRKSYERDLQVLRHLNNSDDALADDMQPHNALQKAWELVNAAESLVADFTTKQGVIKARQELESARRSPGTADFGRLRGLIRAEATVPAVRVVARNGAALQDELLAWIKVQELISGHLRAMSEISAESVRAGQQ